MLPNIFESVNLAPDGERVIVVARGELFSVADEGRHGTQPQQDLKCARARRHLVAGRQMDCLQFRRYGRE